MLYDLINDLLDATERAPAWAVALGFFVYIVVGANLVEILLPAPQ